MQQKTRCEVPPMKTLSPFEIFQVFQGLVQERWLTYTLCILIFVTGVELWTECLEITARSYLALLSFISIFKLSILKRILLLGIFYFGWEES